MVTGACLTWLLGEEPGGCWGDLGLEIREVHLNITRFFFFNSDLSERFNTVQNGSSKTSYFSVPLNGSWGL